MRHHLGSPGPQLQGLQHKTLICWNESRGGHKDGLKHLPYEDRLREFELFSLERAPGRPRSSFPVTKGVTVPGEGLFTRTRTNDLKIKEGKFRSDIRTKFFTVRVLRHRNRFPRELMDVPSLPVFKARLDRGLSNLM